MNLQPNSTKDYIPSYDETYQPAQSGNLRKSSESEHIEAELRLTLEEIARLQNSLAEANMKNVALQASLDDQSTKFEGSQILKPVLQELKQPLHTIQGYLDLLSNESVGILGTFQKRFVERIAGAVSTMEKTLKNLEADSGDEEDLELYIKEFSLTSVLEETLVLYTELIRTKSITLRVDFAKEEIHFTGDQEKFERVLNILFSNSFTAVQQEGTITLGLKMLQGKKPAQVLISVQSSDHETQKAKPLPVNLDEFKDVETKLEGFGSPLKDLIKSRNLVEEMHGKMEIFSIPSNGSLLRIRLPVSR
jgi:signal transduction histidine kinase